MIPASVNPHCFSRPWQKLAKRGQRVVYVTGEEAVDQVRLRATRLGLSDADVLLMAETNVPDIIATLSQGTVPAVTVIDSIQTLWSPVIESAPGSVSQLRAGSEALIRFAKQTGSCVLLVGHVTKDGQIAGPKVVEHMVDTVLYFEGDRGHQFRILRAVKNRFGPTDEIGVFEMSDAGLSEGRQSIAFVHGHSRGRNARFGCLCRHGGHTARSCSRCKRWFLLPNWAHRAAPLSVGTPIVWQ